jgi:FtsP/CotA-like multicopper oxidase with cupredoxin domain
LVHEREATTANAAAAGLRASDLPVLPFSVPVSPRLRQLYNINGYEYIWHCHILEHEEHDMMRTLVVVP